MTDTEKSDWDVVKLMTVHSSKGLEFDYVFVVGCEEGNFPGQQATMDLDEMEEERRLMYVAITRAKDHLFLSYVNSRMLWWKTMVTKSSRFLWELPVDLVKNYDLGSTGWQKRRSPNMDVGDRVINKLYWPWTIKEIWWEVAIVLFDKASIGLRKLDKRMISKVVVNN
jgi:DNA helicase-2/ATP-dependent DNA helicase PcrA